MPFFEKEKDILEGMVGKVTIDDILSKELTNQNISLSMLRLDKIDPMISGNKIFKLKYYLEEAIRKKFKIVTFGGAYSNHLVATAAVCKQYDLACTGIIRGEEPEKESHSLQFCREAGMELQFISRGDYDNREFMNEYLPGGRSLLIPEGGFGEKGMRGASEIKKMYGNHYTHICICVGTATTIAGVIAASTGEEIIGFNVTKDDEDIMRRLEKLLQKSGNYSFKVFSDYNFGGYARSRPELFDFMNDFFKTYHIPTDFVYTGKMMFGVFDLLKKGYFIKGSKILCIHTGGLQGNLSLPDKTLKFN